MHRAILEALQIEKLPVPVVYNSSGYESVETLKQLEGWIGIYLPDFKYADNKLAMRYSHAPDYYEVTAAAIAEMIRQTGPCVFDDNGLLKRGTIIRHLILPSHVRNSIAVRGRLIVCRQKRLCQLDGTVYSCRTCG